MHKLLSICIPTYNRKEYLIPDIMQYLSLKDERFQIIVSDNCSSDNTSQAIEEIHDKRLILIKQDKNIGGPLNGREIMNYSDAEYNFILLDKDYLNVQYLSEFLNFLSERKPAFGIIHSRPHYKNKYLTYQAGTEGLKKFGYKCFHPSGFFIKNQIWKEETKLDWSSSIPNDCDYFFDVLSSIISTKYCGYIVNIPLITISYQRGINTGKSLTYNLNNLYFLPKNVLKNMKIFLKANKEGILKQFYQNIGSRLILRKTLAQVSYEYKQRMNTKRHVDHYGIQNRNVGISEMIRNIINAQKVFHKVLKSLNTNIKFRYEIYEVSRAVAISSIFTIKELFRK